MSEEDYKRAWTAAEGRICELNSENESLRKQLSEMGSAIKHLVEDTKCFCVFTGDVACSWCKAERVHFEYKSSLPADSSSRSSTKEEPKA